MKKNIKFILASFIFLVMIAAPAVPEPVEGTYDNLYFTAITLYNEGACEEAEVEFKRYLFMQKYQEGKYQAGAYCALAGLYEKKNNYALAADCIQKAIVCMQEDGEPQSQIDALTLVHINYLEQAESGTKNFLNDNLFIFSYMNLPEFSEEIKKHAYTAVITNAVSNGRLDYAKKTFETAVELFPDAWDEQQKNEITAGFEKLISFKPKNLKLAGYLSIFPGLGQLYAHDYKDSLNAFLLNGSLIAVSVWSLCTLDFWTFSLLEFNPLWRFMQGNMYNAQKDAYQYNIKMQTELSKPVLDALSK
jgi:tetratricopeptide (TPR) repeat protein